MKKEWHDWMDAPLPWKFHLCRAISVYIGKKIKLERCRCGALRIIDGQTKHQWAEKNSRRETIKAKKNVDDSGVLLD